MFQYLIILFICVVSCSLYAEQESSSADSKNLFTMTPEEMVFAAKLNDQNRKLFCYSFSFKQRQEAIRIMQEMSAHEPENAISANAIVDQVVQGIQSSTAEVIKKKKRPS